MPVHNSDIANVLSRTADLLEIKGENPFRVRAYRNAAQTIESLSKSAAEIIDENGDLSRYAGIGKDLAGKIEQIVKKGQFPLFRDLKKEIPLELTRLMHVSGLGPKRVAALYHALNITSLKKLKKAVDEGRIAELDGFGQKTEQNIREELARVEKEQVLRSRLSVVEQIALPLLDYLKKATGIKNIDIAGSYRRRKETVKDLDILVTCQRGSTIMDHFTAYEDVRKVIAKGKTKSSVLLKSDFQMDVRVVPQVSYGAAMVYFTGSREHNIAIRKIGMKKKLKINEYGVFKGHDRMAGKTESAVYKKVGLPFIPPEMRENRGEIEAAQKKKLPDLIVQEDMRGDLHVHSKATDGRNTIEEMVNAARDMGYQYMAVTDHSRHVTVAGGLTPKALRRQLDKIDSLNEQLRDFTILKGCEVDILEDGSLDLPDDVLKELDIRICSVHYKFNLSRKAQTERVIKAMDNPYFNILGHPTGRLINERPPYEIDLEKIIAAAAERHCLLELNAHPDRLDLTDIHCKMAKEAGVKIAVSTDAHQTDHLHYMKFGIGQARRGWLESADVANTRSLKQLKQLLKRD